jgi:hypothetical protein
VKAPLFKFDIPIEVPYKNATRDVTGITSLTPYDRVIHLLAEKMDAGPTRMAAIGYIPSYKPKNPKPIPKLLEDEECWDKLVADMAAYLASFKNKRSAAAREVKPYVISIFDTLGPGSSEKVTKVCNVYKIVLISHYEAVL